MKKYGFDQNDFDYVKKKGRIHVIHRASKKVFTYFRKKATRIHPETKQWVETQSFLISANEEKERFIENWELVAVEFEKWVSGLEKGNN